MTQPLCEGLNSTSEKDLQAFIYYNLFTHFEAPQPMIGDIEDLCSMYDPT